MVIDVHAHYGIVEGKYHMPIDMQLERMNKHKIDYALISNIECGVYHEGINANLKMIELVRMNSERLGCMLWACENLNATQKATFEQLYLQNRDVVKGIKIHPDISGVRADHECFDFFYDMAEKYTLPILVHTKDNSYSKVEYVINAAKKFPHSVLILGHMEAGTDGKKALEAMKECENIYGDTAWVKLDVVKQAEGMGISHKMMFGTDSPIGQKDRYALPIHAEYFALKDEFMKGVMGENAKKLFKIRCFANT